MGLGKTIGRATDETKDLRQCWRTPRSFFDTLDAVFGFTVDACASSENALCDRYWSAEQDCRDQPWGGEVVFCNPPFRDAASILPKAREADACVFLLPLTALTTRYYGKTPADWVCFPAYRVPFVSPDATQWKTHPSLGTVVLIYGSLSDRQTEQLRTVGSLYRQA